MPGGQPKQSERRQHDSPSILSGGAWDWARSGLLASAPFAARAEGNWPNRPVTIVVPFSPGGNTDLIARLMAEKLSQHIGKPFIVENRSGAGG